jgi:hypothetical protein
MAADPDEPNPESADALVAIAERLFDDERSRGETLTTRASTLAGFSGTILALVATLGREMFKLDLGAVGNPVVRVLFLLSVGALVAAATLAVGGALRARARELLAVADVRDFPNPPWITAEPVEIKRKWLASLATTLEQDRSNNDRRAKLGQAAGVALLIGLIAVAGQAVALGVDELIFPLQK